MFSWKCTFTRDIYILSHCSCSSVCAECDANLIRNSRKFAFKDIFTLAAQLGLEKAGLQVLSQSQLFPNCFHTIYRDPNPDMSWILFALLQVETATLIPLQQLQNFLFRAAVSFHCMQSAFCHIFCPCVLTRWRHNDVRMFAPFLFREHWVPVHALLLLWIWIMAAKRVLVATS